MQSGEDRQTTKLKASPTFRNVISNANANATPTMFKQVPWSNFTLRITEIATVNLNCVRSKSTLDLRKAFVDSFDYVCHRTKMDIDQKIKELAEMFAKASKEMAELVKRNEQFITEEAKRVEEAVLKTTEVCAAGKMEHLKNVRDAYAKRIKVCNEKASIGLSSVKARYDQQSKTAEALASDMAKILKDCMETKEFINCVAQGTKNAMNQRKQIAQDLNEALQTAEVSVTTQLKDATVCYMEAKAEALKGLQKILKDTKDCVE